MIAKAVVKIATTTQVAYEHKLSRFVFVKNIALFFINNNISFDYFIAIIIISFLYLLKESLMIFIDK